MNESKLPLRPIPFGYDHALRENQSTHPIRSFDMHFEFPDHWAPETAAAWIKSACDMKDAAEQSLGRQDSSQDAESCHESANTSQDEGLVMELRMAEQRAELWKSQCAKDQEENRVLKARLNGAHVTKPGQVDIYGKDFSERQLIEFLREAAKSAKEGKWGMWRANEFDAAADAIERMYESYLDECPHERAIQQASGRVTKCDEGECDEDATLGYCEKHYAAKFEITDEMVKRAAIQLMGVTLESWEFQDSRDVAYRLKQAREALEVALYD